MNPTRLRGSLRAVGGASVTYLLPIPMPGRGPRG
ncbi:MAG: hypothetical protein ACD_54C00989G0001, partial [uncultured bacterium]